MRIIIIIYYPSVLPIEVIQYLFVSFQMAYILYYMAIVGHALSIVSLLISLAIFFYFRWVWHYSPKSKNTTWRSPEISAA